MGNRSAICTLLKTGSAAAKQHAKHDAPGDDFNRGQSQRDLHASEEGSAAAKQHAKHDDTGRRFQSWAIAARFTRF